MADEILGAVTCPYCGTHQNAHFPLLSCQPVIICCEIDRGGCDQYFAATARIRVETQAHRIEGMAEDRS